MKATLSLLMGLAVGLGLWRCAPGYGAEHDAPSAAQAPTLGSPTEAELASMPVQDWGDLDLLEIEGLKTFTLDEVRNALRLSPNLQLAAHPSAPLSQYLTQLRTDLREGYRQNGFPQAQVLVALNPDRTKVVARIVEGPRYTAGEIRVVGAKSIPVDTLIERLTHGVAGLGHLDKMGKKVNEPGPLWQKGQPAPFNDTSQYLLMAGVTNALADLGYFFGQVRTRVVAEPGKSSAALRIEIVEEPRKAAIGQINVVGASKNSREHIINYLELREGMAVDTTLLAKWELRLWDTGRFFGRTISIAPQNPERGLVTLTIEVFENEKAPALNVELSGVERALLKLCDWLSGFKERDEDLVLRISGFSAAPFTNAILGLNISPRNGLLVSLERTNEARPQGAANGEHLMIGRRQLSWFSTPAHARLILTNATFGTKATLAYRAYPKEDKPCAVELGGGFVKTVIGPDPADRPGFELETVFDPAAFLYETSRTNLDCSLEGDQLVVRFRNGPDRRNGFTADARSGRLLEFHFAESGLRADLRFEPGAFERQQAALYAATTASARSVDGDKPLSSAVQGLLEHPAWAAWAAGLSNVKSAAGSWTNAAQVAAKLLNAKALEPLDLVVRCRAAQKSDLFAVPLPVEDVEHWDEHGLGNMVAVFVFSAIEDFFPRDTWPWTLAREAAFVLQQKTRYTDAEIQRLYQSRETGPIGFLALAAVLRGVNPQASKAAAGRGLDLLGARNFRNDYRLLLDAECPLSQSLLNVVSALGTLSDADVQALAGPFPPGLAGLIQNTARHLRDSKRPGTLKAIYQSLDQYWEDSLKEKTRSALNALAATGQTQPQGWKETPPAAPKAPENQGDPSTEILILAQSRVLASQERAVGPDHPDLVPTLNRLAELHLKSRHFADAQAVAQRSVDLQEKAELPEPKRAVDALQIVAACQLETEHPSDASKTLRRAAALDVENARTLLMLGIACFDQNEFDAAVEHLSHSSRVDRNNAETFNYLGITQSQLGHPVEAERSLVKAVELAPNYAAAHYNLAVIYATLNPPKMDLARQHYQAALTLGHPRGEQLEKHLEKAP